MLALFFHLQLSPVPLPLEMMGEILNSTDLNLASMGEVPSAYLVVVCFILTVEIVLGVTVNIMVLWAYYRHWNTLRSVSNILMANLNVVDILICVLSAPLTFTTLLLRHRDTDVLVCLSHEAGVSFACSATALNLLVISVDRYESVIMPTKRTFSVKNVRFVLLVPWCGALLGIGAAFIHTANPVLVTYTDVKSCVTWYLTTQTRHYFQTYWVVLFVSSSLWMIVSYRKIVNAAHTRLSIKAALVQASLVVAGSGFCDKKVRPTGARATKVALAIVSTYVLCWGPYTTYSLAVMVKPQMTQETINVGLLCLAYMTTILHPILYAFLRRKVRRACWTLVLADQRSVRTIQVAPFRHASTRDDCAT
ncbi:probable G-protein coupled receptor 22 [Lingula anatina]|uniref:Probable G-protein coupled receptor 22 n=1 Tax=Lingula anatina TaxID=7574 RepID=A0A1S3IZ01_LINAN|nr:probable G-protein coupled receptor 22 [Lingula anatina]|eukprot:XP_013403243.1 probable G-protein coupled receptor 22 [Lingula anatina]